MCDFYTWYDRFCNLRRLIKIMTIRCGNCEKFVRTTHHCCMLKAPYHLRRLHYHMRMSVPRHIMQRFTFLCLYNLGALEEFRRHPLSPLGFWSQCLLVGNNVEVFGFIHIVYHGCAILLTEVVVDYLSARKYRWLYVYSFWIPPFC